MFLTSKSDQQIAQLVFFGSTSRGACSGAALGAAEELFQELREQGLEASVVTLGTAAQRGKKWKLWRWKVVEQKTNWGVVKYLVITKNNWDIWWFDVSDMQISMITQWSKLDPWPYRRDHWPQLTNENVFLKLQWWSFTIQIWAKHFSRAWPRT